MTDRHTILQSIKQAVVEVDPTAHVMLFGSQARGDAHEESDWDILVLNPNDCVTAEYKKKIWRNVLKVELQFGIAIGTVIRNKQDWDDVAQTWFYKEVEKDGHVLQ